MKDPVDHIIRPQLPWRSGPGITECGYDALKVPTLTRAEYFARCKDLGDRRTAMLTCMTCSDTARRHGAWEDDPRQAMRREIEWEAGYRRTDRGLVLYDELTAIAKLIDAHRAEFESYTHAIQRQREWIAKKAAHKADRPTTRTG